MEEIFIEEDELQEEQNKKVLKIVSKLEEKYGIKYPKNYSELSEKEKIDFGNKRCKIIDEDKGYKKCRSDGNKKLQEIWKKKDVLKEKLAIIDARKFMEDNEGKYISMLSYSDNDGEFGCAMEHGGIFSGLSHVEINCH